MAAEDGALAPLQARLLESARRTRTLFCDECDRMPPEDEPSQHLRLACKMAEEYAAK